MDTFLPETKEILVVITWIFPWSEGHIIKEEQCNQKCPGGLKGRFLAQDQLCSIGFIGMIEMFSMCAAQYSSHQPHVTL